MDNLSATPDSEKAAHIPQAWFELKLKAKLRSLDDGLRQEGRRFLPTLHMPGAAAARKKNGLAGLCIKGKKAITKHLERTWRRDDPGDLSKVAGCPERGVK